MYNIQHTKSTTVMAATKTQLTASSDDHTDHHHKQLQLRCLHTTASTSTKYYIRHQLQMHTWFCYTCYNCKPSTTINNQPLLLLITTNATSTLLAQLLLPTTIATASSRPLLQYNCRQQQPQLQWIPQTLPATTHKIAATSTRTFI